MKSLVLGGYGAVGAPLVARLRADGDVALAVGRDPARADRVFDLGAADAAALRALADDADVVINAAGIEMPALAATITGAGKPFVELTASSAYVAALERLQPAAPLLVGVGLAPGLTNLLAAALHAHASGPIDLVVLLGAGERHGRAATEWTYELLGRSFRDPASGARVRNYTQARVLPLPHFGARRVVRADFCDQHALTRDLGVPVRTYFGLDGRLATAALELFTWIPGARHLPRGLRLPGSDRWLVLARAADGVTRWVMGRNQSAATATIAALAARRATTLAPGVHQLHRVLSLDELPVSENWLQTARRA